MKDKRDRAIMLAAQAQHISAFAHFLFISRQIITAMGVIITVDLISMPMAAAMPIRIDNKTLCRSLSASRSFSARKIISMGKA